jgi:hypothetical protein
VWLCLEVICMLCICSFAIYIRKSPNACLVVRWILMVLTASAVKNSLPGASVVLVRTGFNRMHFFWKGLNVKRD